MKALFLILLIGIFLPVFGQEGAGIATSIVDLEMPNSPAFILLDQAPASIQRPNSSRAFGISLLQDLATDGVLDDIAVEVTPFWFFKSTKRSALRFYGIDENLEQNPFSKIKMASFSAAYMKGPDSILNISVGSRFTVFELKRKSDVQDYSRVYKEIQQMLSLLLDFNAEFLNETPAPQRDDFQSDESFETAVAVFRTKKANYIRERMDQTIESTGAEERMQEIIKRKPAVAVDIAVAYNHRFDNSNFNTNTFGRFGIWSTAVASVYLDKQKEAHSYLNVYAFARYLLDNDGVSISTNAETFTAYDLGVKAELEFGNLRVGYEYISRSGDLKGYRSSGIVRYHALDNIYLTGAFGNNFADDNDVIAIFGIQWGLNNPMQSIVVGAD